MTPLLTKFVRLRFEERKNLGEFVTLPQSPYGSLAPPHMRLIEGEIEWIAFYRYCAMHPPEWTPDMFLPVRSGKRGGPMIINVTDEEAKSS